MSKYPTVLLFCDDKYLEQIDPFVSTHQKDFQCTFIMCSTSTPAALNQHLNKLWNPINTLMITVGDTPEEYNALIRLPSRMSRRWIHYNTSTFLNPEHIPELNRGLTYCFVHNVVGLDRQETRPAFSLFTTCYNSFDKIIRAYESIKRQQYIDWEWVIVDDSPHNDDDDDDDSKTEPKKDHFEFLRNLFRDDHRVRIYNRSANHGSIGNVKNEAIALCRGKYVLEMDHDDELLPDTLSESAAVFDANPDVGFVYMDFANVYENGNNFKYPDYYGFGYCGYYCQKWYNKTLDRTQWVYVSITAHVNNITLAHLISLPNHPRIWRKSVLDKMGSYSEYLPICDDQEILMRTAVTTRMAKINHIGYIQYMNDGGNNFSYIRNKEINRIGPHHLCPQFYKMHRVNETIAAMGVCDVPTSKNAPMWKRDPDTYTHAFINLSLPKNGITQQTCVFGVNTLIESMDRVRALLAQPHTRDILVLDGTMAPRTLMTIIDELFDGIVPNGLRCYALENTTNDELVRYFFWLYKSKGTVPELIWAPNEPNVPDKSRIALIQKPTDSQTIIANTPASSSSTTSTTSSSIKEFNTRAEVINHYLTRIQGNIRYVEIGVEYGTTFKSISAFDKTAVDPDPKFSIDPNRSSEHMCPLTSDDFFASEHVGSPNAIFVDGMHQAEYVLRDIKNAYNAMMPGGGWLFVDDVLPKTRSEQLKVPGKHFYENGILKYGEPWTGDVWKVIYYLMLSESFHQRITGYCVHSHPSFRGVIAIHLNSANVEAKAEAEFDATNAEAKDRMLDFPEDAIDEINKYDYENDFPKYLELLAKRANQYM
jgi:glycosyltransferase involved in cell wall biosynthesis